MFISPPFLRYHVENNVGISTEWHPFHFLGLKFDLCGALTEGDFVEEKPATGWLESGEGEGFFEFPAVHEKQEDERKGDYFYEIHYDYNYETILNERN